MLVKKILSVLTAGVLAFTFASVSFSQDKDKEKGEFKIGGVEGKLGLEFRTEFNYDNDGLKKDDATKTGKFSLARLRPVLSGKITPDVSFKLRYNMIKSTVVKDNNTPQNTLATVEGGGIDFAYADWKLASMFGVMFGKIQVGQGGWAAKQPGATAFAYGTYWTSYMPFAYFADGVQPYVNVDGIGKFSLQLVNDVVTTSTPTQGDWNTANKQPAYILEYAGDIGGIMPLVQVGRYDMVHSMYYVVGARAKLAGVDAAFDYVVDNRSDKAADENGKAKDFVNTINSINLMGSYTVPKLIKPALFLSKFDVKQATGKSAVTTNGVTAVVEKEDAKANTAGGTAFNDNNLQWCISANYLGVGDGWEPYIAILNNSGDFYKAATGTEKESNSKMEIKLGVIGNF